MSFACDKLSKLSMMCQTTTTSFQTSYIKYFSWGRAWGGGEWGMFVLVRENSSLHWRQRRGPLMWGGLLFKRAPENILACEGHLFCSRVVRLLWVLFDEKEPLYWWHLSYWLSSTRPLAEKPGKLHRVSPLITPCWNINLFPHFITECNRHNNTLMCCWHRYFPLIFTTS